MGSSSATSFYLRVPGTAYHNTDSGAVPWDENIPSPDSWCAISAMGAVSERLHLGTFT
jgi:alkanesulfonate monooxygenase SsuD/methylene tetrahydromethanopterin reductase-like flavin-dependent oxidoreductase (luciferase family)